MAAQCSVCHAPVSCSCQLKKGMCPSCYAKSLDVKKE